MKSLKNMYRTLLLCICLALTVPVSGIAAVNTASVMYVGSKKAVKKLTVKSSKKKVISVKKSGKKSVIIPKAQGEAVLRYYKGKKLKEKEYVLVLKRNSVRYDTSNLTLQIGKSQKVKAVAPKKCKISYSSSNGNVATVSKKGVIKGIKSGSCIVTAKITYRGAQIKAFPKKVTVKKKVSGKGSSDQSDDSSYKKADLIKFIVKCNYDSVPEGHRFSLDDFTVYGEYSNGKRKNIKNFRITCNYASANGYYEVVVEVEGKAITVEVPVSGEDSDDADNDIENPELNNDLEMDGTNGADTPAVPSTGTPTLPDSGTPDDPDDTTGDDTDGSIDTPENVKAVGIEVHFSKTEIPEGYDFPMSDFTVYTLYSNGTKAPAGEFGFTTSYSDGYYTIHVTSGSFSEDIRVKASASTSEPYVTKVKFELTAGTVKVGENLAPGQIKVTAIYSDGTEQEVTDFTHDFTPKMTPGQYKINITWGNAKGSVTINVVSGDLTLKSVDVKFLREYLFLDETPSKSDFSITGNYTDGSSSQIDDFTFTFTPANGHNQKASITVTVEGKSVDLSVICYDRNIPIALSMTMSRSTIRVNENIDPSTITLVAEYRDGRKITETDFTLDFTPKSVPGSYPVVLTFRGQKLDFTVEVVE